MIVRDEAAMLPGFLAAAAGLWDELIVADTGSRDGSPDLIRAAGGQVVDFPWCDDFAAARNASLAPAGGRWILFLDADERIDGELTTALRRMVTADRGAGAATVTMRNALPDGSHREARLLRCFRNVPEIRFRHRIHEDVADDVATFLARERRELRHLPGGVDHLGYVRETAAARQKKERDLHLLRAALQDDPHDLYCRFKLLELARFWDDRALWATEADAARRALESITHNGLTAHAWSGELAALISQTLSTPSAALAWLDTQAHRIAPGPAWHLRRGVLLESCGRLAEAETAWRACLTSLEAPLGGVAVMPATRPLLGLCRLAVRRGDALAAVELARRAVEGAPRDPEALLAVVSFLADQEAADFAAGHAHDHPDAAVPLAQALLTAGRPERALAALARGRGDPHEALGVAVLALTLGLEMDVNIDLEAEAAGQELRGWLLALWGGRRADLRETFTAGAGALTDAFPWLESWLAERSGLSPSHR
jgi:tetratricopeptide (TPR) repeat protein